MERLLATTLSSLLLLITTVCHAYSPPVGIPDPGWGIDEVTPARPDPWSAEILGHSYVNDDEAGCSDSRSLGYPGFARCTVAQPIPSGTRVEIAGVYGSSTDKFFQASGTAEDPSWIVGISGSEPTFTGAVYFYGTYLFIDGVKFTNSANVRALEYTANHIMVRNSEIDGVASSMVQLLGTVTTPKSNIIYYNNYIHDTTDWDYDGGVNYDPDDHGITISEYVNNVWILQNTFYQIGGNAIQINGSSTGLDSLHHIYIGKNTASKTRQSTLGIKKSSDIIISENILHDTREAYNHTGSNYCAGVSYQYAPQRVWIINNTIYDADHGIKSGSETSPVGDYVYMIGNLIYDINNPASSGEATTGWDEGAAIRALGVQHAYVVNNTIFGSDIGIETPQMNMDLVISGNIVSDILYDHLRIESDSTANPTHGVLSNNLFFQDAGDERLKIGANIYTVAIYPYGTGNYATDPVFVDATNNNYRIQTTSPAKDAGVLSDVYATFQTLYGIDIKKDIAGIYRPQNTLWDMGAYEYNEAVAPHSLGTVLLGQ